MLLSAMSSVRAAAGYTRIMAEHPFAGSCWCVGEETDGELGAMVQ